MAKPSSLTIAHLILAIAIMAVWGTNFVVIRVGLDTLPPLFFAFLRYLLAAVPAVFFLKRPEVSWKLLAAYGLLIGCGQFGVLFFAMTRFISPGLASLVIQTQVFFTIALAMAFGGERVRPYQVAALLLAVAGIGVIAFHADKTTTTLGLALVLGAALSWGLGNMVSRAAGSVNMLAFVVWASLFSAPPLLIAALITEGWPVIEAGLSHATAGTWIAVVWQAVGNTLFGFGAWGWLLARYPAATVTPLALLVPVFGMAASALLLGEPMQRWKLVAAGLVLGGLALNVVWPRLTSRRPKAA